MSKTLIIVESPTKIKTLQKLLGPGYAYEASYGHVRDLPQGSFGIDIEGDFEPTYKPLPAKKDVIQKLKSAAKNCSTIYLSPDPDREGEAIAWHILSLLGDLKGKQVKRVAFQAFTKSSVSEALSHPQEINMDLVNAQQARRLLDRLVGYTISPLLNRRLRRGKGETLSGGRVQSVALKLVVDREKEIENFQSKEYWNLGVALKSSEDANTFHAYLYSVDGKRVDKDEKETTYTISTQEVAQKIKEALEKAKYTVSAVEEKEKRRNPEAPFTTSTLQQEASRHFYFSPSKTMEIAQQLYEGVDFGQEGPVGLITYMRTDSVRIAPEALAEARNFISHHFGKTHLPETARQFHVKKTAQDAHEAIRPNYIDRTPDEVRPYLTKDQFAIYSIIWKRFIASQMAQAIYNIMTVSIDADPLMVVRATGSQLLFAGFLAVYEEKQDEDDDDKEKTIKIPPLKKDQVLLLEQVTAEQAFTRPPGRFTEATLIKELEKSGIGRPSTYASIMKKILARDYTIKEQGRLKPTDLGRIVTAMLETSFPDIVNIGFTAAMEDSLEEVASEKRDWKSILREFWKSFSPTLEEAKEKAIPPKILLEEVCPKCGKQLQKIWFKTSYFVGCTGYPECTFSVSEEELHFSKEDFSPEFDWEQKCPKCHSNMKVCFGRFGPFFGCSDYPKCKTAIRIPKKGEPTQKEQIACPATGCTGHLVQRMSRFKKIFFSCSAYPACDVIGNDPEAIVEQFKDRPQTAVDPSKIKKKRPTKGTKEATKKASARTKKTTKSRSTLKKKMTKNSS